MDYEGLLWITTDYYGLRRITKDYVVQIITDYVHIGHMYGSSRDFSGLYRWFVEVVHMGGSYINDDLHVVGQRKRRLMKQCILLVDYFAPRVASRGKLGFALGLGLGLELGLGLG